MKRFEQHLETALRQYGWSHEETLDLPDRWWAARAWRIQSTTTNFGYELFLTFIGHYQDGNEISIDDPVGQIIASERIPMDQLSTDGFTELLVDATDYPRKVEAFVVELDEWRNGCKKPTEACQADAGKPDHLSS